jgi:hypothetical protein
MAAYLKARSDSVVTSLDRFLDMLQNRLGTGFDAIQSGPQTMVLCAISNEWNGPGQSGCANEKLGLL